VTKFSQYAFSAAFITTGVALLGYLWYSLGMHKRAGSVATFFTYNGAFLLTASLGARWIASGHAPYSNQFEFATSFAWGTLATYLYMEARYHLRSIGFVVIAVAFALLTYASTLPARIDPLIAALQNHILIVHVGSAIIAYGAFTCAFAAGALYLINRNNRWAALPSQDVLDEVGYKAMTIAFPAQALLLILGAVWANEAWGAYWSWDPKETAALFTWLIAAAYMHARAQRGWHGTRTAWLLIATFGAVLFTFFGNYFLGGLHTYSGL
jgi:cytochrome c-type biogenesis protein CcsB